MVRRINYVILEEGLDLKQASAHASRAASASLLLSYGIRKDTILTIYWTEKNLLLRIPGATARNIRPDEESTLGAIKSLLKTRSRSPAKPPVFREPCIRPDSRVREINVAPLLEAGGFTVTDPLGGKYGGCLGWADAPQLNNPVEAIIIFNTVMDVCKAQRL